MADFPLYAFSVDRKVSKNESPLSTRLIVAFIASMMGLGASASPEEDPGQPKLVVGIVVEDLQEEYIHLLRQYFTQGGFNRLVNRGVRFTNVDYGTSLDPAAATAVIYTGASPSVNGVASMETFDRATLIPRPVFTDRAIMGNYTNQTLSPKALRTSTIADEMRISGDGFTYAYAISAEPAQALIMAGHAGNCGVWLNDANDSWATTTYYRDTPEALNHRNSRKHLARRLDTINWTPILSPAKYTLLPKHLTATPFRHQFNQAGPDKIKRFKNSPCINSEITDFAIDHIKQYDLGAHDGPDIISINYNLEPFAYSKNTDNRYELIDSYYRLDRDLDKLLDVIDKKVGLPNALVFLASTPAVNRSRRDDEKWRIPYGEFSTRKAISLLNLYLVAIYGNGNWVQGYHNGQFYLNHDLIKKEDKNLEEIREHTASLLAQMEGVAEAFSIDDIINNRTGEQFSDAMRRNIDIKSAGDVTVKVMPGWQLLDDFNYPSVKPDQVTRDQAATAALYLMAPGLAPTTITTRVDARQIAPTVTRILRIRSPNGASMPPLPLP